MVPVPILVGTLDARSGLRVKRSECEEPWNIMAVNCEQAHALTNLRSYWQLQCLWPNSCRISAIKFGNTTSYNRYYTLVTENKMFCQTNSERGWNQAAKSTVGSKKQEIKSFQINKLGSYLEQSLSALVSPDLYWPPRMSDLGNLDHTNLQIPQMSGYFAGFCWGFLQNTNFGSL